MVSGNEPDKRVYTPEYDFGPVNRNTELRTAQLHLTKNGDVTTGTAKAVVELLPRPKVTFHCSIEGYFGFDTQPKFEFDGVEIKGFHISTHIGTDSEIPDLIWTPTSEPVEALGDDDTSFDQLKFHIFNFISKVGNRGHLVPTGPDQKSSVSVIELFDMNFEFEIWSVLNLPEVQKQLKQTGGYGLTHIGILQNRDGTQLTARAAKQVLQGINDFLTFANGARCLPTCAVGLDKSCDRKWEYWSSPGSPWTPARGWFDGTHSKFLVDLFKGFFNRYDQGQWKQALHSAIYWYSKSSDANIGIDSGIILTQTALEQLAFEYCVNEKTLISAEGFEKLAAADQLRMLLSSLDIPIAIPEEAKNLSGFARAENWEDAPRAITIIRNRLVHPKKKGKNYSSAFYDTWNISLWFLELVILRLCDYDGEYGNRITQEWAGEKENVPWAQFKVS